MPDRTPRARAALLLLLAALALSLLPAARARAAGGLPSAILDPASVAWASVRGMTSQEFGDDFAARKAAGYMVIDIEVDEIDGQQRVAAVWQKNTDGRDWAEWRNLTAAAFEQKWTELRDQGFRLIDQDSYVLGGARYYAGVRIKNVEGLGWLSHRLLTSAEFADSYQRYRAAGYIMVDVEAFAVGDTLRYSDIWVDNAEGLQWVEWRDMTSDEFAQKFEQYRRSYRMLDVESYLFGGTQYYAGIWVANPSGRGWAEWRDMSAKGFGNKWLELRDAGYRLTDFEAYETKDGFRYAGIWRQNSRRPDWALKDEVDALVEQHADDFDVPGMSVAIAQGGAFLYLRGFGYADVDDGKIATSHTVYRLASVSKAVAGVLAMRLVEQGDLDLAERSDHYVPALPAHHTHTVAQTLSNRAGIGHYDDYDDIEGSYGTALAATMELWDTPLVYQPGMGYLYSTHAYTFAGASMELAAGQPVGALVRDELTVPYGLGTLRMEDLDLADPNRATLYDSGNDEVAPDDLSWKVLGGGLEASAYDLCRLGMKLAGGGILSAGSRTTLWTPPDNQSNYALGWNTGTEDGTQVVAKDGAQNGARSYIRMYPEKGIVIVVLSNRKGGGHSPSTLAKAIGAMMLDAGARPADLAPQADAPEDEPAAEGLSAADVVWPVNRSTRPPTPLERAEPDAEAALIGPDTIDLFLPSVGR